MTRARIRQLLARLSPAQYEAMLVFLTAELAEREGADFDAEVAAAVEDVERFERTLASIGMPLIRALFDAANEMVAARH